MGAFVVFLALERSVELFTLHVLPVGRLFYCCLDYRLLCMFTAYSRWFAGMERIVARRAFR